MPPPMWQLLVYPSVPLCYRLVFGFVWTSRATGTALRLRALSNMTSRLHRRSRPLRYTLWPCMEPTSKDTCWVFRLFEVGGRGGEEKGHGVFTQAGLQINSSPANVIILNSAYLLCEMEKGGRLLQFIGGDRCKNSRSDPQIRALQRARSSPPYHCSSEGRTHVSHMNVSDVDNIATAREAQPQPAIRAIKLPPWNVALLSAFTKFNTYFWLISKKKKKLLEAIDSVVRRKRNVSGNDFWLSKSFSPRVSEALQR